MDMIDYMDAIDYLAASKVLYKRGYGAIDHGKGASISHTARMISWLTKISVCQVLNDVDKKVRSIDEAKVPNKVLISVVFDGPPRHDTIGNFEFAH